MMYDDTLSVKALGLSARTMNVLEKNGVDSLDKLMGYSDDELMRLPGFGKVCLIETKELIGKWLSLSEEELQDAVETYRTQGIGGVFDDGAKMEVGEFLGTTRHGKRLVDIFIRYFATDPRPTLDEISQDYGVTRERIRQIINKGLNRVRMGILRGEIKYDCIEVVKKAAEDKTEISLIDVSDRIFGRTGFVRLLAAIYDNELKIINVKKLYGEWLVRKEDNVSKMIDVLSNTLRDRDLPMKVEDVLTLFPINEEMLLSIKNVVEKDGYVTLSTNKIATGTGRFEMISSVIKKAGRPVSVNEIIRGTGLTFNQVRGSLSNNEEFVNVGKSVYDLADEEYLNLSLSDLARNILLAEDRALKISKVVDYIQRYRSYMDYNDYEIISELLSDPKPTIYRHDGFFLLNEWGLDKIEPPKQRHYSIMLEDAIMDVVLEMEGIFTAGEIAVALRNKYSGAVSTNLNSIKQRLGDLAQQEKIIRVGDYTGCFIRASN